MIWGIVIVIVLYFLIRFLSESNKDNEDLVGQTLDEKFSIIVNMLNQEVYNGTGAIRTLDKKEFNLFGTPGNHHLNFSYGSGLLTIKWRYKYYQKEVIHKKDYLNVRNLSIFEQERIANNFINEIRMIMVKHQNDVLIGN